MAGDDGATLVIDRREEFTDMYAHARAWVVPASDRYPDGVKYSFQYGIKDESTTETENEDGTIIRYNNFPDHPNAPIHHKHLSDGTINPVDFTGVRPLFEKFKIEVTENYDEHWN